ncbi:methylmalonyl-CoA mutase family protein [Nocardioides psychrotolerans]|uniref:Methylmalonyl-CoA mutase n=1 Tax=Nocardioides psychrotolerans TaxID=1005945 RepID=A0A1I3BCW7_9ACTN|nr:methylmalonyl-CoA mutase family protein [Nocardioides psychrotolerans]SFH60124.1 methylmalonyl-CoA mutase [Nocardioides psychrotolerans]
MTVEGTPAARVDGGLDEPTELEPEQGTLDLASPEDRHTLADWEAATAAVLRKSRRMKDDDPDSLVWKKLTRTTLDGIDVTPLGTASLLDDLSTSGRPTRSGDWDIRAHLRAHDGQDAKALNETALVDLNGGVTSLWLQVAADADLASLLHDVLLDLAPVVLDATDDQLALARVFLDVLGDTTPAPGTNLGGSGDSLVEVAQLAHERGVLGVVVDATAVHDRGASDAQELGWSVAAGADALRRLTGAGLSVDEAAGLIEFRYAATDDQFATIAKLRAARRLWARVVELSEGTTTTQRQHVVTSRPMMSTYDPYVNMLRTTVAAFAAGVGGADAVTVLPFDSPLGAPEVLGRRIARNTSALLISESHVAKVADPAGGSYAVEKLTDDLAVAGWAELGRIEEDGPAALEERIAEAAGKREVLVAKRRMPITGLTEFPHLAETRPERRADGAFDGVRRYGASFEALRDDPAMTPVFLSTLGTIAAHTARATFAANLLAAGGIAVEVAGATSGVDDLLAAYADQPVVCLAGSDTTYAEWGQEAITALRGAGARHVVLAGVSTGSASEAYGADDGFVLGVDALDFLTRTREKLA